VIIHMYEEKGVDCVRELDGMFTFVISDEGKPFAARDTLGIKPLYYAEDDERIYFSSELKSLVDYVDEVKEFPPGHYYTPETGFQPFRLVEVPYSHTRKHQNASTEEIAEGIRQRLERAVVKRLMADVPLGVLLSGGLDSSLANLQIHVYHQLMRLQHMPRFL